MNVARHFSGASHAIRNSTILIATQFASILIRLIYLYVLVRYLSPASYGVLTYGMYWYLILLPFTYLGTDVVLGREIGRDRTTAPALIGATLSLRSVAFTVGTFVSIAMAALVETDPQVRSVLIVFSFSLIGRTLWMWSAAVFTAFERVRPILAIEIVCRILEIAVLIILIEIRAADLLTIAAVHSGSWFIQGITAVLGISRRWPIGNGWAFSQCLRLLREGLPGAAFSIAMSLFFQLPLVLFRRIEGTGNELGYFALALQIITYLAAVPYLAASASLPALSRSAARKDAKDRTAAIFLIAAIILGGLLLVAAASFVGEPMVRWLFGERYADAAVILDRGLWLLIPASLAILFQHLLFANRVHSALAALAALVGVAAMAVLFPELTRSGGSAGALWSMATGLIVWVFLAGFEAVRSGFFKRRMVDVSSAEIAAADVW